MQKKKPLLTVSIPTWNRGKYVRDAIDSIVSETEKYGLQDEVEILVSDNGSDDDTQAVASERQLRYPYVRYLRNERNMGLRFNILRSMREAGGDYCLLLGDDDRLVGGSLAKIVEKLREVGTVAAMFVQQAGSNFAFADIDEDTFLSPQEIFGRYFWDMGNAGVFIVNAAAARSIIDERGFEFFSHTWPQTQILCLSLAADRRPALVTTIKAADSKLHDSLSIYSGNYLWRAAFADLLLAAHDLRPTLGDEFWRAASAYMYPRMSGIVNDVMFYGCLVDTEEQRRKAAESIRDVLPLLPWGLRLKALLLWAHVGLPRAAVAPLYRARLRLLYGPSVIRAGDERARKEMEKRRLSVGEQGVRELV